jgi:hypothetical protein
MTGGLTGIKLQAPMVLNTEGDGFSSALSVSIQPGLVPDSFSLSQIDPQ